LVVVFRDARFDVTRGVTTFIEVVGHETKVQLHNAHSSR
jgi:hypothetical protein